MTTHQECCEWNEAIEAAAQTARVALKGVIPDYDGGSGLDAVIALILLLKRAPSHQAGQEGHLPDCMMPDGAEPCKGFLELQASSASRIETLKEALDYYACDGLGECTEPRLKDGVCIRASLGSCGHYARAALADGGG